MTGPLGEHAKPTYSLREAMVVIAGMALVFWLMFARDDGTIRLAIFGYLAFSVIFLVVMPMFLFHRRCPECRARALYCMGVVLLRPPLGSYYSCAQCRSQFQRQPFRQWIRLGNPLPSKMFPLQRGSGVLDPVVWLSDPIAPQTKPPSIVFFEDSEP
jgi:hypothetical protein